MPKIDLLLAGSPCQGFSYAGKGLNFDDERSKLFFEFVKALKLLKPTYFLLENVKMKSEWADIISEHVGVDYIEINSKLVSGQLRSRYFWTNIPGVKLPEDRGIKFQDILEKDEARLEKAHALTHTYYKKGGEPTRQRNFLKHQRPIAWLDDYNTRWLTPLECERLQTVPENYTSCSGKVSFYNHEPYSAFLALQVMDSMNLQPDTKVRIFKLITMHTEAFKKTTEELKDLLRDDQQLYDDLVLLSFADANGRFFAKDKGGETLPDTEVNTTIGPVDTKKMVVFMVGLPASGKSTEVFEWVNELGFFKVCRDDIIHNMSKVNESYNDAWKRLDQNVIDKELEKLLKIAETKDKVIIDMTNLTRKGRKKLLKRFYGYAKVANVVIPSLDIITARNCERSGKFIRPEVYERMIKSFYLPLYDEFDHIFYTV